MNEEVVICTPSRLSGGAKMYRSGKRPILLGLLPAEKDLIRRAAEIEGRSMARFVLHHAMTAAANVVKHLESVDENRVLNCTEGAL